MRLYLGGYLDFYHPQRSNWLEVELEQPAPMRELLAELGIPAGDIHLYVLNGELVDPSETLVTDQDEVKLFPPIGGG
jgi:molybdopterin converting factor small subunit